MPLRILWLVPVLTASVASAAPLLEQDTTLLKWKLRKGMTFYQTMTSVTDQDVRVMGMELHHKQDQTFYVAWTVLRQNADKGWSIRLKIEGVKIEIDGNIPFSLDSTTDNNPDDPLFKALVGAEFTFTFSPEWKMTRIEGPGFLNMLLGANPQWRTALEQINEGHPFEQMANFLFAAVPNHAVKEGDTWPGESILDWQTNGSLKTSYKFTDQGKVDKDKKLEKIHVDARLTYMPRMGAAKPPINAANGILPFRILKADLKSKDSSGTILFDIYKGRIARSDLNVSFESKLTGNFGGLKTDVDCKQTQKTTMTTSDTNPLKR